MTQTFIILSSFIGLCSSVIVPSNSFYSTATNTIQGKPSNTNEGMSFINSNQLTPQAKGTHGAVGRSSVIPSLPRQHLMNLKMTFKKQCNRCKICDQAKVPGSLHPCESFICKHSSISTNNICGKCKDYHHCELSCKSLCLLLPLFDMIPTQRVGTGRGARIGSQLGTGTSVLTGTGGGIGTVSGAGTAAGTISVSVTPSGALSSYQPSPTISGFGR